MAIGDAEQLSLGIIEPFSYYADAVTNSLRLEAENVRKELDLKPNFIAHFRLDRDDFPELTLFYDGSFALNSRGFIPLEHLKYGGVIPVFKKQLEVGLSGGGQLIFVYARMLHAMPLGAKDLPEFVDYPGNAMYFKRDVVKINGGEGVLPDLLDGAIKLVSSVLPELKREHLIATQELPLGHPTIYEKNYTQTLFA
jgi:hypothetical protein